jgi:hypothetical protein
MTLETTTTAPSITSTTTTIGAKTAAASANKGAPGVGGSQSKHATYAGRHNFSGPTPSQRKDFRAVKWILRSEGGGRVEPVSKTFGPPTTSKNKQCLRNFGP